MSLREIGKRALRHSPAVYRLMQKGEILFNHFRHRLHDPDLVIFSQLPAGLVLDVGANIGQSAVSIGTTNQTVEILSIEPNVECEPFLKFARSILGRRFSYSICGIGDKNETRPFYVPIVGGLPQWQEGTFDRFVLDLPITHERLGEIERIEENNFKIVTIDSMNVRPVAIKLDVQGHEMAALRGAENTLKICRPMILLERSGDDGRIGEYLVGLGYRPYAGDLTSLNAAWI